MRRINKWSIDSYVPNSDDKVIFDTSVLIKIFYPLDYNNSSSPYEKLYLKLHKKNSEICVSSIQISEFINRCIRFRFAMYSKGKDLDFKRDYRDTEDYHNHMDGILNIIKTDIIPNFAFIDDGFSTMNYENIFKYGFSYDFNDALIAEIAKQNDAYLITDDKDFINHGKDLKLVTANKGMLKFI